MGKRPEAIEHFSQSFQNRRTVEGVPRGLRVLATERREENAARNYESFTASAAACDSAGDADYASRIAKKKRRESEINNRPVCSRARIDSGWKLKRLPYVRSASTPETGTEARANCPGDHLVGGVSRARRRRGSRPELSLVRINSYTVRQCTGPINLPFSPPPSSILPPCIQSR